MLSIFTAVRLRLIVLRDYVDPTVFFLFSSIITLFGFRLHIPRELISGDKKKEDESSSKAESTEPEEVVVVPNGTVVESADKTVQPEERPKMQKTSTVQRPLKKTASSNFFFTSCSMLFFSFF